MAYGDTASDETLARAWADFCDSLKGAGRDPVPRLGARNAPRPRGRLPLPVALDPAGARLRAGERGPAFSRADALLRADAQAGRGQSRRAVPGSADRRPPQLPAERKPRQRALPVLHQHAPHARPLGVGGGRHAVRPPTPDGTGRLLRASRGTGRKVRQLAAYDARLLPADDPAVLRGLEPRGPDDGEPGAGGRRRAASTAHTGKGRGRTASRRRVAGRLVRILGGRHRRLAGASESVPALARAGDGQDGRHARRSALGVLLDGRTRRGPADRSHAARCVLLEHRVRQLPLRDDGLPLPDVEHQLAPGACSKRTDRCESRSATTTPACRTGSTPPGTARGTRPSAGCTPTPSPSRPVASSSAPTSKPPCPRACAASPPTSAGKRSGSASGASNAASAPSRRRGSPALP